MRQASTPRASRAARTRRPGRSSPTRPWKRTEYYRLADLGFFDGQRVELVHGRIFKMPPMKNTHCVAISLVVFGTNLLGDAEMCMPGDNARLSIELINPIAMDDGVRFAIREGGRTVGSGVVTKILE